MSNSQPSVCETNTLTVMPPGCPISLHFPYITIQKYAQWKDKNVKLVCVIELENTEKELKTTDRENKVSTSMMKNYHQRPSF